MKRLLELFSGTHSVGKIATELGYTVTSLDLKDATINLDILDWDYTQMPVGHFDVIWASSPCDTFSVMKRCNVGRHGCTYESLEADMQHVGVPLLHRTEAIISYFQPRLWFIENPQTGKMKEFICKEKPFYDVDYCMYSNWGYKKRTRIWTNKLNFKPKICQGGCGFVRAGCHLRHATGGNNPQGKGSRRTQRYQVPSALVSELLC